MKRVVTAALGLAALAGLAGCAGKASAAATPEDFTSAAQQYFNAAWDGELDAVLALRPEGCAPTNAFELSKVKEMLGEARVIVDEVSVTGNEGKVVRVHLEGGRPPEFFTKLFEKPYTGKDGAWTLSDGRWRLTECPRPAETEDQPDKDEADSDADETSTAT